jgi:hypothetical protein
VSTLSTLRPDSPLGCWLSASRTAGTNFNNKYPHGVGRRGAHDQTSGTPVTNFKRSTRIYKRAINHNSDLDRDRDGIACEKA